MIQSYSDTRDSTLFVVISSFFYIFDLIELSIILK